MKHYVVLAKCYNVNEAGDEKLDEVNILMVEHSREEAIKDIMSIREEYIDDDYIVGMADDYKDNGGIIVTNGEETVSFYIHIYYEEVD